MTRRITYVAAAAGALAALSAAVAESPKLPPAPVVPAKAPLPPQNFTQALPGPGGIKFEMVYVPGGEFVMGSPEGEPGRQPDEGPQRKVAVKPFWLGKVEVTWDEYYEFWKDEELVVKEELLEEDQKVITADAITKPSNTFVDELYDHGRDGHPAICMTHHAAMMYCHWLRLKTKKGYRLPTEAEWEYACRAGTAGLYGFEGKPEDLGEYAWFKANSGVPEHTNGSTRAESNLPTTHVVGTKKPNKFGLYDMHGNVAEWCLDHYDPKFYAKAPAGTLVLGPANVPTDKKWSHVVRGGSWADTPGKPGDPTAPNPLRAAARRGSDKSWMKHDPQLPQSIWWLTKMDVVGFRVALPVDEYPNLVGVKPMVLKKVD